LDKKTEIKSDYSFISIGSELAIELSDFSKGKGQRREDTINAIVRYCAVKTNLLTRHFKKEST
jgi:hypothetical protein